MLDAAGFGDAIISASSDLDEYLITSLKQQGAKINSWGVGTNLITSNGWSAFGGVYKLAAIKNKGDTEFTPKIKISENPAKITNPGNKTVFRFYDKRTGKIRADLIALADEKFNPDNDLTIFDPNATWKKTTLKGGTYTVREMLVPIFKKGQCVYENPSTMEIQKICTNEKKTLWDETMRLTNPQNVYVDLSDKLFNMKQNILHDMSMK
jgi:nicotinate phosphoribosyltransferase